MPVFEAVNIPFVQQFLDADRTLQPNEVMTEAAAAMLDELARVEAALRPLREPEAPSRPSPRPRTSTRRPSRSTRTRARDPCVTARAWTVREARASSPCV